MQKRPELGDVVLQRRARDEQPVGGIVGEKLLDEFTIHVLQAMSFILGGVSKAKAKPA